jgi:hypothetical protein
MTATQSATGFILPSFDHAPGKPGRYTVPK